MSNHVVAKRYAVALFELAKEHGIVEKAEQDLRLVRDVFTQNNELETFLDHPRIEAEQKKQMLKAAFATVTPEVLHTLFLMVDRHRAAAIIETADAFIELSNEEQGIAEAKVYSVRALTDDERHALSEIFAKRVGKQSLHIENFVDESLLGGVKLRIGNRIYDGSVSGKLSRIERELVTAKDR